MGGSMQGAKMWPMVITRLWTNYKWQFIGTAKHVKSVQKVMGSVARLQNRMEKVEAGLQELKNELSAAKIQ